jgi:hypothetical protein
MKTCPKCNKKYDDALVFCEDCGARLEKNSEGSKTEYCSKCGSKIQKKDEFCSNCGKRLKQKVSEQAIETDGSPETSKIKKIVIVVMTVLIVLFLAGWVVFVMPFEYTAVEAYTEKMHYDAQESYVATECNSVTSERPHNYDIRSLDCQFVWVTSMSQCDSPPISMCRLSSTSCTDYHHISYVVSNSENQGGYFTFNIGHYLGNGALMGGEVTKYIGPYSSEMFEREYCVTGQGQGCGFQEVSIPTISETTDECHDVTKTRTVTKYRDVPKEREVSKYASLFDIWTGNVKWYYQV